jgi:predicted SAM-dependent methyltransferase
MDRVKLHLGCGKRYFGPDWIHIDSAKFDHVQYYNIRKLPFKDNSVDVIYASHLIAYFDRLEIMDLFYEWKRVLKVGGILRLATPDLYKMTKLYVESKVRLEDIHGPMYGRMPMNDKTIYHKTVYDYPSLAKVLMLCGFKHVRRYDHERTDHALFDDHSAAYLKETLISLNVECNA